MTFSRGIRGAITVEDNSIYCIGEATIELLNTLLRVNSIKIDDISHVIFTITSDLNAAFPAKFARDVLAWHDVPMMCFNEADVKDALKKCIRVLMVVNTDKQQNEIKPVYLKEAAKLRPDISQ